MRSRNLLKVLPPGVLSLFLVGLTLSLNGTAAVSPTGGPSCSVALAGSLASTSLSPAGSWTLASSSCTVTGSRSGVTWGTFTGTFSSGAATGTVSGSWSTSGTTEAVSASSTEFSLMANGGGFTGQTLGMNTPYRGILTTTGGELFVVGMTGQIATG